jgi:hypothetical protein
MQTNYDFNMKKHCVNTGLLSKNFYEDYLKYYTHSFAQKKLSKFWNEYPDEFIEYKVIGFRGPKKYLYNELWLLDILDNEPNKYFPVYITNINTSSNYSLSRTSMNEEEQMEYNIGEMMDLITDKINKDKFKKNLLNN